MRIKFVICLFVSRNESEPSEASLLNLVVVSLPKVLKPVTRVEATVISTRETTRGKMGRRA